MGNSGKFWNRTAEKYNRQEISDIEAYKNKIDCTVSYLKSSDLILDFACGTGTISLEIASQVNGVHAIDTSEKMIEIANRNKQIKGVGNITFQQKSIFDKGLNNSAYNAILAFNILHLIKDLEFALERINNLLKPGGIFISNTACLGDKYSILKYILPIFSCVGLSPYVKILKFIELKDLITKTGFQIENRMQVKPNTIEYYVVARKMN